MSHPPTDEAGPGGRLGRSAGIGFGTIAIVGLTALVVVALIGAASRELRLTGTRRPAPAEPADPSREQQPPPVIRSFTRSDRPPPSPVEPAVPSTERPGCEPCPVAPPVPEEHDGGRPPSAGDRRATPGRGPGRPAAPGPRATPDSAPPRSVRPAPARPKDERRQDRDAGPPDRRPGSGR